MKRWDGVPPDKDENGWHWVRGDYRDARPTCAYWNAEEGRWVVAGHSERFLPVHLRWVYLGKVAPPC